MENKEFLVTISMVNGDKHNVILKKRKGIIRTIY